MIALVNEIPFTNAKNAEYVKICCLFDCYGSDSHVLFWRQNEDNAVISMTDGNMIIFNNGADTEELRQFADMLNPVCIYSDYDTLCALGRKPAERINVMIREPDSDLKAMTEPESLIPTGDELSSKELYSLLDTDGLSLPEYSYFAVDYCRRLNHGGAEYFGIKDKCAVITFNSGENAIINGIASHKKGYGGTALKAILNKNHGRRLFVCCRDKVKGFYTKNGFEFLYYAGYWVKNK